MVEIETLPLFYIFIFVQSALPKISPSSWFGSLRPHMALSTPRGTRTIYTRERLGKDILVAGLTWDRLLFGITFRAMRPPGLRDFGI